MRWSLLLVGLEEDKHSTMALGYLMRGREESGIVAPKWYDYEDLVGYVSIVAEEVQNLEDLQGNNWKQRCSNLVTCTTIGGSCIQGEFEVAACGTYLKFQG